MKDENEHRLTVIRENPINDAFEAFRTSFALAREEKDLAEDLDVLGTIDKLDQDVLQDLSLDLLSTVVGLRASRQLHSVGIGKNLSVDIARLILTVNSDDFNFAAIKPLLVAVLEQKSDKEIWDRVYDAVPPGPSTPHKSRLASVKDTPFRFASSAVVNSSEQRDEIDSLLHTELGIIRVDLDIYKTFFGAVDSLRETAEDIFKEFCAGDHPRFDHDNGWRDWPDITSEKNVCAWLLQFTRDVAESAERRMPNSVQQSLISSPNKSLKGSVADRKVDAAFVDNKFPHPPDHWGQILAPVELKKHSAGDCLKTWLDLARYAREIFKAQDTRRYVLGFTLAGSIMRLWNFDRVGGIGSAGADINQDGLQFVSVVLGFLYMDKQALGFDPTVITSGDKRYIEINHEGQQKRLILGTLLSRSSGIVTRGTTCWEARIDGEPQATLVLKESWQPIERNEGELLRLATQIGVTNVARHYHDLIVQVGDKPDDIQNNIRKGLDCKQGTKVEQWKRPPPTFSQATAKALFDSKKIGSAGTKRCSSQIGVAESSNKRHRSDSPIKQGDDKEDPPIENRVRQRVIMRDYGIPIYNAESPSVLLESMAQCVGGHKSLYDADILHRDISINNLLINADRSDPSQLGLLIDLDLAIKISREKPSGATSRTGTRAFMSIGVLLGEPHSFMDDIESFFWVLFWICIHYLSPKTFTVVPQFEKWNYISNSQELAVIKLGTVTDAALFNRTLADHVTDHYKSLIPCLSKLREMVFPGGTKWKKENMGLYDSFQKALREALDKNLLN
ncbi:serine threonine- kinase sgk2 [Trichoderma cornu-damae]|uniref:non-specific serine/threonine protein kinase n=1 Tax=Trichoderma cornu-damae TaxID=654480 RepID=A0A9P8TRQ8_9HYPO|nr:serine threonine- kinase sgk2 [Trichoderma cornu-damae]